MCHDQTPVWPVDRSEVLAGDVRLAASDGAALSGYFAQPRSTVRGHLLLIHDGYGMSEFYRSLADRFAAEGIACLLLNVFSRLWEIDPTDEAQFRARRAAWDQLRALDDCGTAADWLRDRGARHVTMLGFCMGGTLAIIAPTRAAIDASIVFYGLPRRRTALPLEPISPLDDGIFGRVPVLGFWGEADDLVGMDNVEDYARALTAAGVPHEFHRFAGLGHAYLTFDPEAPAYPVSLQNFRRSCEFAINRHL